MYIGVYAYGESRFTLMFDPCFANIHSMCPINASVPIEASGIIPIAPADVAGIPEIALSIPDFEGQAILRIFANSTQSQIACYSAVLTNGHSFSHPIAVGSTVGVFVAIALVSSVATAIYGQGLQETRKHYAHSLSVFVVFSVLQHVFFTGALSMNFPSVLVAFWSNFGWASGMIYSRGMQNSINQFIGSNRGNISMVGSAPSGQNAVNLGGGYSPSMIYKRAIGLLDTIESESPSMHKRSLINSTSGFSWYGNPVAPGLPLPGNYSSFAGTLAELHIPASNAFLTGLLWFLILIALLGVSVAVAKVVVELLVKLKAIKTDRLSFFRKHWIYCGAVIVLRACYIAFFMITFLAIFQFTIGGAAGTLAVAGIVLALALLGIVGLAGYALWYRMSGQKFQNDPDQLQLKLSTAGKVPRLGWTRKSTAAKMEDSRRTVVSLPWRHLHLVDPMDRPHVHDDDDYLIKFGWLSARFRRSKWWFFAAWLVYELVRACFYGGAAGHPLTQVFGLLAWEILALFTIVTMRPFESNRLNMLMVYCLGFSKVVSVALCSAFDPRFGLGRILTTVIGIIIIVIQGVLIILMMIAVVVGAISSYMSVRRYQEDFHPQSLANTRTKFFTHLEHKATDKPLAKAVTNAKGAVLEEPKQPYFSITSVRRETKIEDEDLENENENENENDFIENDSRLSMDANQQPRDKRASAAPSVRSRTSISNLPYGARRHRASWSTRDFHNSGFDPEQIPSGMHSRMSIESIRDGSAPKSTAGVRQTWTANPSLVNIANAAVNGSSPYRDRHQKSKSLNLT